MDAPPEKRNLFGPLESDADFARRGIRLRQFGQRIIEIAGGKRIHPSWGAPGGVLHAVTPANLEEIRAWIPEAMQSIKAALSRLKPLLDSKPDEVEHLGNFPTLFLGTVTREGTLEYYDEVIRIVDAEGSTVAEGRIGSLPSPHEARISLFPPFESTPGR